MSFIVHRPTSENPVFLPSRLGIPQQRRECLVKRPHLIEKLNEHIQSSLMVITAPAGWGKTTLLAEWALQSACPVAWVSLLKEDNTDIHFWTHVVSALQTLQPHLGEDAVLMLSSLEGIPTEAFQVSLLEGLYSFDEDFVLVLDDYQLITENTVQQTMENLVDHLPQHMHLVIASREVLPFSLSRLRVNEKLFELNPSDLQFGHAEIADFFSRIDAFELTDEDINKLLEKTGGWVALLQLTGLALRQKPGVDVGAYIAGLSGSDHLLAEYLIEEVLAQQPVNIRRFLLRTSVLDPLCGELCDAVLRGEDDLALFWEDDFEKEECSSAQMLERLECSGIPMAAIDYEHTWYRYHPLFVEMLRSRLRKEEEPETVLKLYRRASIWYEKQDLLVEAVETALSGADFCRVAQLIEEHYGCMALRCDLNEFLRWNEALPADFLQTHPRLCIARAWALLPFERMAEVEGCLRLAESIIENMPDIRYDAAEYQSLLGEVMGMRVLKATQLLDIRRIKPLARMALDLLPPERVDLRGVVHICLGIYGILKGELADARLILTEAMQMQFAVKDRSLANSLMYLAHYLMGVVANNEGRLDEALGQFRFALRMVTTGAGNESPIAGVSHIGLSSILYEKNDIEGAIRHARVGLEMCKSWWLKGAVRQGHLVLAHALQIKGDQEGALESARKIYDLSEEHNEIILSTHVSIPHLQVWMRDKALGNLSRFTDQIDVFQREEEESGAAQWWKLLLAVQILLAEGRIDVAIRYLNPLLEKFEKHGHEYSLIECLVMQVYLLYVRGDHERALRVLLHALSLAEDQGYLRVFLDAGAFMKTLLEKTKHAEIDFAYIETILEVMEDASLTADVVLQMPIEPLSRRELEVLHLLANGLSTREIADQLYIAVDTVRKHTKNILAKLQVHTRLQAVQQARDLNLL